MLRAQKKKEKPKKKGACLGVFSWAFHCVSKAFLGMGNGKAFKFFFFSMPTGKHLNEQGCFPCY
jgi:hypothetical protein